MNFTLLKPFHLITTTFIFILVMSSISYAYSTENFDWKTQGQPLSEHFDTMSVSGHPQNFRIKQDKKGYIYVANGAGILIFNGKDWQILSKGEQQVYFGFALNEDGRIYTGTTGELGYYEADKRGNWQFVSLIGKTQVPDFTFVGDVLSVGRHVLYITEHHLFHFHPDMGLIWHEEKLLPSRLFFDGKKIMISSKLKKIFSYSLEDNKIRELNELSHPDQPSIYHHLSLDKNEILLGSRKKLYLSKFGKIERFQTEIDDWLANKFITRLTLLGENKILIATRFFGFAIVNMKGELIRVYNTDLGLKDDHINDVLIDKEKNIWLAHATNGISRLILDSPVSQFSDEKNLGLSSSTVVFKNQVFTGAFSGLFQLKASENATKQAKFAKVPHDFLLVLSFLIDGDVLLIGSGLGIDALTIDKQGLLSFSNIHDSRNNKGFYVKKMIHSKQDPSIVYAISHNGLIRLIKKQNKWKSQGLAANFSQGLSSLHQTSHDELWVGTIGGKFYRINELDKWPNIKTELISVPSPKRVIEAQIFELDSNVLLSNSIEGGLLTTDANHVGFTLSKIADWQKNNITHIEALEQNNKGVAWFATQDKNFGVNRIGRLRLNDQKQYDIDFFDLDWVKLEFLQGLFLADNGDLWVNSRGRILRYQTHQQQEKFSLESPVLTKIIELGSGRNLFTQTNFGFKTPAIELAADENSVSLHFSAVNYRNRSTLEYRYRLSDQQQSWSDWSTDSVAEFTNLEPGEFLFELQYRTNPGNLSPIAQINLQHLPYWHQLLWVRVFALLALISCFIGFAVFYARFRNRKLSQQAENLENQIVERTVVITQQNKRLVDMDEAKNRFFVNVSHEFRTPLSLAIAPLKEVISSKHLDSLKNFEYLKVALKNNLHMVKLLDQILDINRLEVGKMSVSIAKMDLSESLHHLIRRFEIQAEKQQISFELVGFEESHALYFDADHFEKIILNLISNAVKFSPAKSTIEIGMGIADNKITLWVKDEGPGIGSDEQLHIFERYYQGRASSNTLQPGTGIGLALVKELLTIHQGTITVESELGKGAQFTLMLMADASHYNLEIINDFSYSIDEKTLSSLENVDEPMRVTIQNAAFLEDESRKSILIVDDNAELRQFIRTLLDSTYNVLEADNGQVAFQQVVDNQPDLIVCDIMMPVMDGLEFAEKLKSTTETAHIPLILLTAKSTKEETVEGLRQGADDYLSKPFDSAELVARIAAQLAQKQRIADKLYRKYNQQQEASETKIEGNDEFSLSFNELFNEKLGDPKFDVEQMCDAMKMSRSSLFRQVKKRFNCTPVQLLRIRRLELSLQMLKSHSGTVSEVAYAVGFQSLSAFSRAFSEHYKTSPVRVIENNNTL